MNHSEITEKLVKKSEILHSQADAEQKKLYNALVSVLDSDTAWEISAKMVENIHAKAEKYYSAAALVSEIMLEAQKKAGQK